MSSASATLRRLTNSSPSWKSRAASTLKDPSPSFRGGDMAPAERAARVDGAPVETPFGGVMAVGGGFGIVQRHPIGAGLSRARNPWRSGGKRVLGAARRP